MPDKNAEQRKPWMQQEQRERVQLTQHERAASGEGLQRQLLLGLGEHVTDDDL